MHMCAKKAAFQMTSLKVLSMLKCALHNDLIVSHTCVVEVIFQPRKQCVTRNSEQNYLQKYRQRRSYVFFCLSPFTTRDPYDYISANFLVSQKRMLPTDNIEGLTPLWDTVRRRLLPDGKRLSSARSSCFKYCFSHSYDYISGPPATDRSEDHTPWEASGARVAAQRTHSLSVTTPCKINSLATAVSPSL